MKSGLARDKSIVSMSGISQQALTLNGGRTFLKIMNTGSSNVGVNYCGGTAAIGGTGTETLTPGGSMTFDAWVPQNAVNVIGTAGQPIFVAEC